MRELESQHVRGGEEPEPRLHCGQLASLSLPVRLGLTLGPAQHSREELLVAAVWVRSAQTERVRGRGLSISVNHSQTAALRFRVGEASEWERPVLSSRLHGSSLISREIRPHAQKEVEKDVTRGHGCAAVTECQVPAVLL